MSYASEKAGTEHYPKGEFDAFGPDGKRIKDAKAVILRRRAVRERDAKQRNSNRRVRGRRS
jgi:hypothetical protein